MPSTAPTSEEIRLAVLRRWTRWRGADDNSPWSEQPLGGRFRDAVIFDLYCEVHEDLYASYESDLRNPLDEIVDEVMDPIMDDVEQRILEGMATMFERYAAEFPKARRARKVAAS